MNMFRLIFACGFAGMAIASCDTRDLQSEPTKVQPNIVLILLDDLGFSDIGAFGSEIRTPSMDEIASGGRVFSQFYVHPRCSPTRASLMTGMYPHQVGLGLLAMPKEAGMPEGPYQGYLSSGTPTLASTLKASGYRTYMSGKWHLGEEPEFWPRAFGFDRYFGLISGASSYYEIIEDQPRKRRMALDDEAWSPPKNGFFMTDATTDFALTVLKDHFDQSKPAPFFLYVAYTAPHWPLHAPESEIQAYNGVYDDGWSKIASERSAKAASLGVLRPEEHNWATQTLGPWEQYPHKSEWARRMQTHAAMVTAADRGIGEIYRAVESAGALENTIFLILSDNGASGEDIASRGLHEPTTQTGERGSYVAFGEPGAVVANAPLRDYKGSVHEGGVRSPLIASWPAHIPPASQDKLSVFGAMDLPSTLLSIAGAETSPAMEGIDVSGALMGDTPQTRSLYWEHVGWRGVRDGDLKAISGPGDSEWQLFDLSMDPAETTDLSNEQPGDVERLSSAWVDWSSRVGAEPIPLETLMKLYGQQEQ